MKNEVIVFRHKRSRNPRIVVKPATFKRDKHGDRVKIDGVSIQFTDYKFDTDDPKLIRHLMNYNKESAHFNSLTFHAKSFLKRQAELRVELENKLKAETDRIQQELPEEILDDVETESMTSDVADEEESKKNAEKVDAENSRQEEADKKELEKLNVKLDKQNEKLKEALKEQKAGGNPRQDPKEFKKEEEEQEKADKAEEADNIRLDIDIQTLNKDQLLKLGERLKIPFIPKDKKLSIDEIRSEVLPVYMEYCEENQEPDLSDQSD